MTLHLSWKQLELYIFHFHPLPEHCECWRRAFLVTEKDNCFKIWLSLTCLTLTSPNHRVFSHTAFREWMFSLSDLLQSWDFFLKGGTFIQSKDVKNVPNQMLNMPVMPIYSLNVALKLLLTFWLLYWWAVSLKIFRCRHHSVVYTSIFTHLLFKSLQGVFWWLWKFSLGFHLSIKLV